ncbi:MAG TPA: TPM domain-containing protein [Flavobacteriales bacterium]|nr:TPM domain-containing protein [Flavobacteriales bacterium]HMW98161.1 TPM domain-containing protein [Flavobacteriales bacterium]HNK68983.1 TPM domain-containing protein [Flavobacteriales bacterium]HNK84339.1 TPM domain-containing protein [Flavobacteriales bacterium]HNO04339.1 TPM domain-containing protein [Flavobacteriales bacterium]
MRRAFIAMAVVVPLLTRAAVDPCLPAVPADQDHLLFQYVPWLSEHEAGQLDAKLVRFARETSNQVAIVVVDTLCGYDPGEFAFRLGESWGLGKAEWDNAVLILVKPIGAAGDRHVLIATGYGLEEKIPDAVCRRIVDNEILPRFREGRNFEGLDAATNVIFDLAKGAYNAKSYGQAPFPWGTVVWIVIILIVVIGWAVAQQGRVKRYAKTNDIDFWSAWWLLNQAGRSHRGSWGGFTGGGGWGGGGGGGFGGFGGGSFGGGGAGGSW